MINNLALRLANRINPKLIFDFYARKFHKRFNKSCLVISFDCDTEEDIKAAWDVHARLTDIGITPVYAVPGALLKKGETVYKKIYETGAEFINHGGREHTYFDKKLNRHTSCFFYDQEPYELLKEDIVLGHETLQNVLGLNANGWRTPHFGTFQKKEQLQFLYKILRDLKYSFSTSTIPQKAYLNGPIYNDQGMVEIPVTGIFTEPMNIMDTWAYFAEPNRQKLPEDYLNVCQLLANFASVHPILINIYGDPSHIHKQAAFFDGMKLLAEVSNNVNYTQLLGMTY